MSSQSQINTTAWYQLGVNEVLQKLNTSGEGLSEEVLKERQLEYGPNALPEAKRKTLLQIFFSQFLNPLIYVLLVAAVVCLFVKEFEDAIFILAVVGINALLGTWQESKAEDSANALRSMVKVKARVRRGNRVHEVQSEDLVPGDIVLLEPGMKVPADLRLTEVNELIAEEALLTGESNPVSKTFEVLNESQLSVGDRTNMAFAATAILKGRGTGVVVETAKRTEMGKIADSLATSSPEKPPLIMRMDVFSRNIAVAVVGVCIVLGLIGYWQGMAAFDIFIFMVAVGVSAIPEGLPISLTVALSVGTSRMARRNVIVRKLPAVEGLGSCTLVASDKTGTLTMDEQSIQRIVMPDGGILNISGQGYNGDGEVIGEDGSKVTEPGEQLAAFLQASILANEGILRKTEAGWEHSGDAVDVAFRAIAYKLGKKPVDFAAGSTVDQMVPYESEKKYSGVFFHYNGELIFAMKGAVEVIMQYLSEAESKFAFEQSEKMAAEGLRVLALASGVVPDTDMEHVPTLRLLGLAGLIDPLRPEAIDAIEECHEAGITVKMVTGDHPATALAIAKQLGIASQQTDVMTGIELDTLKDKPTNELGEILDKITVFARVNPLQKRLIVEAGKEKGHFVAVTGDGANDAPALKVAHIGIAMGGGTDLTKETASIIITDNNFASIAAGVEEGRFTYDNLRKIIYLLISTGMAEILLVSIPLILMMPLPFIAVQLLWLNIVTNGIQDKALAFEKGDKDVMKKPPRKPSEPIFDKPMLRQLFLSASVMALFTFGLWYYLVEIQEMNLTHARSKIMMLMVLFQNFHVLNCRSETKSIFHIPFRNNWFLLAGVLLAQGTHIAASYTPWLSDVLQIEPITLQEWFLLLGLASSIFMVMEIYKYFGRQAAKNRLKPKLAY